MALPQSILVADIGGTHFRAGLVLNPATGVCFVHKLRVADYQGPVDAVKHYLDVVANDIAQDSRFSTDRSKVTPCRGAFAVATPVNGNDISFTNSKWHFSVDSTRQHLGFDRLNVINDFEALALSLPSLRPDQYRAHGLAPLQHGTLAVLGPGTGLGVAGLKQIGQQWIALPGEGGHASLSGANAFELDILKVLLTQYPHVSAERLLSGIGMPLLYNAIAKVQGQSPDTIETPALIERALNNQDPIAVKTVDVFCAMLGSFAGNVALITGARSGLFVGGGIVPRLGERFFESEFRARFEAKGRFADYLAKVPTALITDSQAALSGAAIAANL